MAILRERGKRRHSDTAGDRRRKEAIVTLVTQESGAVPSGCFDSSTRLLLPHILSFDELGDSHLEENFDHLSCPSGEKEPACHTRKVGSVACSSHPPVGVKDACEMSQYAKGRGENTVANRQHLDMLEQGVVTWNHWRKEHPDIKPDLKEASLIGAALSEANLSNAKLRGANLLGADLLGADLSEAILRGADLFVADLSSANLFGTTLSGADLSSANLNETDVSDIKYLDRNHDQRFLTWVYPRAIMRGKYQGIRVASCYGKATFKRDAQDQDFLDTLEKQWEETWRMWLFRAWGIIDYGRSMFGVFLLALIIVLGFGLTYHFHPDLISYRSHSQTPFSPFYFSIVTFTTLGFGDVTPNGVGGEMIVSLQVISGYLTLGLLISILANKVARRS